MLHSIDVLGLRGFATRQTLLLSRPNGTKGSGLTIVVGANNAGKSTVIEALRAIAQRQAPSFTQGRRNAAAGDLVDIRITNDQGETRNLKSIRPRASTAAFTPALDNVTRNRILVLPSRRMFSPYFSETTTTRDDYMAHIGFPIQRTSSVDAFTYRLFAMERNGREAFNAVLAKVLNPLPDWSIDQTDQGQSYLKITKANATHSSEGMGEGLVSLLHIVDALHDSAPDDCIAIDEPELSLHPALQRKVAALLLEYSSTRQIVIATHSPYFTSIEAILDGGTIARVHNIDDGSVISQLTAQTAARLRGLIRNQNNPHILGLNAQEVFFIDNEVILVEGQEDVVFFQRIKDQLRPNLPGSLFGWGVGGADNMETIAQLLKELGFSKVVGILDANKAELAQRLQMTFPLFKFVSIAANDIRTKPATGPRGNVVGLLDDTNLAVRPEYRDHTIELLDQVGTYLGP